MTKKNFILKFFEFIYKSKSVYKIHSPFLFKLLNYLKSNKQLEFDGINLISNKLKNNSTEIKINDKGAGSKFSQKDTQRVKDIYKRASKSKKQLVFLSNINSFLKAENFIELGTSLGITSSFIKINNPETKITTIEADETIYSIANENFNQLNIKVNSINDVFDNVLENICIENKNQRNIFFIDGNHTKSATLKYFEIIKKYINKESVIIFDDIKWSVGMMQAWDSIIADKAVFLSLDFFSLGVTFFNKDIRKQHHLVRHFL